jgi:Xaa-Pro aminopeptidase
MKPQNLIPTKPRNLATFTQKLAENNLDAVIASSAGAFYYLSRSMIITHLPIRDRLELLFWPKVGDPVFILCDHERWVVLKESWIQGLRTYVEFERFPMEVLAELILERGLGGGRIGIEFNYLRGQYFDELKKYLPEATFVSSDFLFNQARMIKTPEEIDSLRQAARLTEQAIRGGLANAKPGDSEKTLASRLARCVSELGAIGFAEVVAAGPHSFHSYPLASPDELLPGELVRIDLKGTFNGYASDVGRMAVVGQPTQQHRDAYSRIRDVQLKTVQALRPGQTAASVYNLYSKQLESSGLSLALPYVGHSIGFGGQEYPILQPLEDQLLEANMVLSLEPAFDLNGIRFKIEDTIWVTDNGAEWLTDQAGIEEIITIPI